MCSFSTHQTKPEQSKPPAAVCSRTATAVVGDVAAPHVRRAGVAERHPDHGLLRSGDQAGSACCDGGLARSRSDAPQDGRCAELRRPRRPGSPACSGVPGQVSHASDRPGRVDRARRAPRTTCSMPKPTAARGRQPSAAADGRSAVALPRQPEHARPRRGRTRSCVICWSAPVPARIQPAATACAYGFGGDRRAVLACRRGGRARGRRPCGSPALPGAKVVAVRGVIQPLSTDQVIWVRAQNVAGTSGTATRRRLGRRRHARIQRARASASFAQLTPRHAAYRYIAVALERCAAIPSSRRVVLGDRLDPVVVQREVAAAARRSAARGCRPRSPRRARARRSCRRGGSSRAGGRPRTRCGRRAASRSACSMRASVGMSTLEVASSRISSRGSASSARAKATSWRWPIESRGAALLRSRCRSRSGSSSMNSCGADRAGRRLDLLAGSRPGGRRRCCRARCPRTGSPPAARSRSGGAATSMRHVAQVVAVDQ